MKFTQNTHPTHLFGPTCLIGTWEYITYRTQELMPKQQILNFIVNFRQNNVID